VSFGTDLQTEHERWLAETHFGGCVFVYDYPRSLKSFYMRDNSDVNIDVNSDSKGSNSSSSDRGRGTCAAFDLLVPGVGELVGGSQREERLEVLEAKLREWGLDPRDYWWYVIPDLLPILLCLLRRRLF